MSRFDRLFARYAEVIPDYPGFLDAVARPVPLHLRVNTLKSGTDEVLAELESEGARVSREPWCPLVLRAVRDSGVGFGATLLHALGHIYIQSASSAVPALALQAVPGDRVLDLCAAPGSKTTLLAQEMEDRGSLVANEPNRNRVKSLAANLERVGVTSVVLTAYSGQNFPLRCRFDRVLVDAPCSGEGTWRGPEARPRTVKQGFRAYLARQQGAILRRGYEVLAPGGSLVYSTCTYAPEENEEVMASFLEETGARMVPIEAEVPGEPGLTTWGGRRFPEQLALARRIYPHRLDSEGFFVARMVKP